MITSSLQPGEGLIFALRELYDKYGYSRYKMNKFEEYDLYAKNKDFLISEGVITFNDTNGKLMALKPDVTLSIVKNTQDVPGTVSKLYYNENVYRVSKASRSFTEIMQVGLEAIGDIDAYCIFEVLKLACESLENTGKNCILEISHLGIISEIISYVGIPADETEKTLGYIGQKNAHEIHALCRSLGIADEKTALLCEIASLYGTADEVMPKIGSLLKGVVSEKTMAEFGDIVTALAQSGKKDMLRLDFSVVNDMNYYNGFVFKGFAEGLPSSILSGGQYDSLLKKMNRTSGAIGFAVYLDILEKYDKKSAKFDVDNLLIYESTDNISDIDKISSELIGKDESVLIERKIAPDIKYRKLLKIQNGEVKVIEENA